MTLQMHCAGQIDLAPLDEGMRSDDRPDDGEGVYDGGAFASRHGWRKATGVSLLVSLPC